MMKTKLIRSSLPAGLIVALLATFLFQNTAQGGPQSTLPVAFLSGDWSGAPANLKGTNTASSIGVSGSMTVTIDFNAWLASGQCTGETSFLTYLAGQNPLQGSMGISVNKTSPSSTYVGPFIYGSGNNKYRITAEPGSAGAITITESPTETHVAITGGRVSVVKASGGAYAQCIGPVNSTFTVGK